MENDERANTIIKRIRGLAESYNGKLLLDVKDAGSSGTGYISLTNGTEIIFDFVFASWGFKIDIRGLETTLLRQNVYNEYSNEGEIDSVLRILEMRIKILENSL